MGIVSHRPIRVWISRWKLHLHLLRPRCNRDWHLPNHPHARYG